MCWIFAYNGKNNSIPFLLDWLNALEYRGYDSSWIFAINSSNDNFFEKSVGRVSVLSSKVDSIDKKWKIYTNGIAHTRWATHGLVTEDNTHPHYSENGRFYIVHNWIIENYKKLKDELEKKYKFYSETDTEVVAKLIEELYEKDLKTTLEKVVKRLVWAYSIAVIDTENPDLLIAIKLWSPLLVWKWEEWIFLSSDINALSWVVKNYVSIDDNEIVVVENWKYTVFSSWDIVSKSIEELNVDSYISDKWSFSTFTEKEIFEIPEVIDNAMKGRVDFENRSVTSETLKLLGKQDIERIEIIASGSSYFAGFLGSYFFKDLAWIPSNIIISSEFLCSNFIPDKKTLYIFLSQSWETADVRESLKIVKAKWCLTFWIVNSVWTTIAKLSDMWLYCHSWVEIWVASTKNVIAQEVILLVMSLYLWNKRNLQHSVSRWLIEDLKVLKDKINIVLMQAPKIKIIAKKYSSYKNFFYLWRNILYPVASECSLKLKELSYLHSESYSTWELKHWPLALVWPDFPTVVFNTKWSFYHKTVSNIKEIKARNWTVLWIVTAWDNDPELYDDIIELPETSEIMSVFTSKVAMYLFSLYVAEELWRDIDKPQNLAKSVTVE